jgi:hypothetical protein
MPLLAITIATESQSPVVFIGTDSLKTACGKSITA